MEFKAFKKSSRTQSDQIPGGGPPALLINISGESQASSILFFPSSVVMSHAIAVILTLCDDNWSAAFSISSFVLAQIVKDTPAFARASAQPNPNPLEDAQTIAFFL